MSVIPATVGPIFAPNEAYLASEVAPACYASPGLHCELDLTKCSVDMIEPSPTPTMPMEKVDDLELARSQPRVEGRTRGKRETIQIVTLCLCNYMQGWNDGSSGPLLPRLQEVYKVHFLFFLSGIVNSR